ncbi:MAG: flagellar biosynthesis protein FlhF [Firmicutes bacterium]|nr:flagellar biosynthesis protein FlhF [Bacillota bacterium]
MKIRKYYARDVAEGFLKVKKELGSEAIILQTRKVRRRGLKGWFMPRQVEIIAALGSRSPERLGKGDIENQRRVEAEISELKVMVQSLVEEPRRRETEKGQQEDGGSENDYWRNYLQHHDVDPVIIDEIFGRLASRLKGNSVSREMLPILLREEVTVGIPVAEERADRTVVFIGPTGVGKTTTLAKLAARYALNYGEKVGLVTIDHYRIGAVDQLRAYAEIIDLPLEVAYSPRDLSRALVRLQDCDRILVDTAGRATGNQAQVGELADYIEVLLPAEVHLVISATTRWQDIRFITGSFSKLHYNRLLITKLDETTSYGAVLNGAYYVNQPLVYITDGQGVPDDLKLAREMDFAGLFWGGER